MIIVEQDHSPLITTRWVGEISLADYDAHVAEFLVLIERARATGGKLALVVDSSQQGAIDSRARKRMADAPNYDDVILGAFVVLNGPAKLALTAMKWLGSKRVERVFAYATLREAYAGAIDALVAAGVAVPAGARNKVSAA